MIRLVSIWQMANGTPRSERDRMIIIMLVGGVMAIAISADFVHI